jgi:ribosomal protein L15
MVDGQVGYHRPENLRRVKVDKNNSIVNQLNKTKQERHPDLAKEQQDRLNEIQAELKAKRREDDKAKRLEELERQRVKEERSYDRIMTNDNMMSNTEMNATADSTAAEEFEDDFM